MSVEFLYWYEHIELGVDGGGGLDTKVYSIFRSLSVYDTHCMYCLYLCEEFIFLCALHALPV